MSKKPLMCILKDFFFFFFPLKACNFIKFRLISISITKSMPLTERIASPHHNALRNNINVISKKRFKVLVVVVFSIVLLHKLYS